MAEGEGGYYSCYFKNEYGEAVSSGWVEVMETPPVHQKMHDKHHHDEEQLDFNANNSSHSVLLLSTVIGAVVGLLLAALALLYCTKYQVACSKLHSISLNADAINVMFDIWMNNEHIYFLYQRERRDKLLAVEEAQTVLRWTRQVGHSLRCSSVPTYGEIGSRSLFNKNFRAGDSGENGG